jgi:hypothetical protein
MRSAIVMAAIVTFAAGTAFEQQESPPAEVGNAQHPPIHVEQAPPVSTEAAKPAPVINSEEQAAAKIENQEQAKAKIESEGYTEVSELKQDTMGMWTATAMKDGKPVLLSLNAEGRLSILN